MIPVAAADRIVAVYMLISTAEQRYAHHDPFFASALSRLGKERSMRNRIIVADTANSPIQSAFLTRNHASNPPASASTSAPAAATDTGRRGFWSSGRRMDTIQEPATEEIYGLTPRRTIC